MSPDTAILRELESRLPEAVDRALLLGLLKYTAGGKLQHAPFALTPCPIPGDVHQTMVALSPVFNRLARAVAADRDFLAELLAPAARVDDFTARLLDMAREAGNTQPLHLAVTRSDYFLHQPDPSVPPLIRQVELNTIAASYPGLSALVHRLHRDLLETAGLAGELVPNDPIPLIADAFVQAVSLYGHPDALVMVVVQPGEANVFDQRLLEFALQARGLRVVRRSLDDIAREGALKEGHLALGGEPVAVTYFRAAYGPEDFTEESHFRARALIEASATISVPGLFSQLAGAKKVQQALTDPAVLSRFLDPEETNAAHGVFAAQHDLEADLPAEGGSIPAWRWATEYPGKFVLKPQREGGGHNFFNEELVAKLSGMAPRERAAYVLMERIHPPAHPSILVTEGTGRGLDTVSEIGRYAVCLADGERELLNRDVGYLVRTKGRDILEGGVSAGFGFLDSLRIA